MLNFKHKKRNDTKHSYMDYKMGGSNSVTNREIR